MVDWLKAAMEGSHLRGPANVLVRCADLLAADVDAQLRPVSDFLLFAGLNTAQVRCCSAIAKLGFRGDAEQTLAFKCPLRQSDCLHLVRKSVAAYRQSLIHATFVPCIAGDLKAICHVKGSTA